MEILARAAEQQPVAAVPGLALVIVIGVVVVALTGLSRSIAAERGSNRRLVKAERQGREQAERAVRDAVVLRLAELLEAEADADADAAGDAGQAAPGPDTEVDLTGAGGEVDLTPSIDLTATEQDPIAPTE